MRRAAQRGQHAEHVTLLEHNVCTLAPNPPPPTVLQKKEAEAEDKDLTTQRVAEVYHKLSKAHKKKGVTKHSFLNVVVNPNSFPETVENIFHLSFLVKRGQVVIQYENDEPYIGACARLCARVRACRWTPSPFASPLASPRPVSIPAFSRPAPFSSLQSFLPTAPGLSSTTTASSRLYPSTTATG